MLKAGCGEDSEVFMRIFSASDHLCPRCFCPIRPLGQISPWARVRRFRRPLALDGGARGTILRCFARHRRCATESRPCVSSSSGCGAFHAPRRDGPYPSPESVPDHGFATSPLVDALVQLDAPDHRHRARWCARGPRRYIALGGGPPDRWLSESGWSRDCRNPLAGAKEWGVGSLADK